MRGKVSISKIVSFVFVLSLVFPSTAWAQTEQPPVELNQVEPVFQTVSAQEPAEVSPQAFPKLGQNWLINGTAESGTDPWTGGPNDFIVSATYGTPGMPSPQDPGPTARGSKLFSGSGTNPEKNAWLKYGVDPTRYSIDQGGVRFTLSGFLGGKDTRLDQAILRVYFGYWNQDFTDCQAISSAQIGPVTAADRNNRTGLLERVTKGTIPIGTECFSFQLQMYVQDATAGTAYADNLFFAIDGRPTFLPITMQGLTPPVNTIPAAPNNLVVSETALTSLSLSWQDNSNNESGFLIERAIGASSTFSELARVGPGMTVYQDKGLNPQTTYKYHVSAYNGKGYSAYASVTGVTLSPTSPPNTPNPCWTSSTGDSTTKLGWTDNSNNEEYFILGIKLPGSDWVDPWVNVEPNATYVSIIDLPSSNTTYFRIRAHNAAGDSSYCETSATTGSSLNMLTIQNNASYPIASLEVDGMEQFPVYPMGIETGGSLELYLSPGTHTVLATTGFWQNKTDRFFMYTYYFEFVLNSGGIQVLEIQDIPIEQILTQFSPVGEGYWEGYYFDSSANCHTAAFRFYDNKTFRFYVGNWQQGTGTYELVQRMPSIYGLKFSISGGVQGLLLETSGQFYMDNGPSSWKQITYVYKPQGYVYNPFCP